MPHIVETCPDDLEMLNTRLDELAAGGARIISVVWQTRRVQTDQMSAHDASGSFVIVAERGPSLARPLPRRDPATSASEEFSVQVEPGGAARFRPVPRGRGLPTRI